MKKHTVLITGAAGYVGAMLVDQWSRRDDVECIVALDMAEPEEFVARAEKTVWIQANTADFSWQETVAAYAPDTVVHAAWHIRNIHGKPKLQWHFNVEGSYAVFDFAFSLPSVKRLVHFSSAAILGADPNNEIGQRFDETAPPRDAVYLYAYEKKVVEVELCKRAESKRDDLAIAIIRPAAISGPRGRYGRVRFGLQAALSGKLKGSFAYTVVSTLTSFIPATKKWCRQFIHEDDVVDIVTALALERTEGGVEIFNLAPPGDVVLPKDMGEATGKRVIVLPPWMIRIAFFFARHLSFGKLPTAAGAWQFYSFPIVMDGSKVERTLGHTYAYSSKEAFTTKQGRYAHVVPNDTV